MEDTVRNQIIIGLNSLSAMFHKGTEFVSRQVGDEVTVSIAFRRCSIKEQVTAFYTPGASLAGLNSLSAMFHKGTVIWRLPYVRIHHESQ